jgi:LysR family transcriptional regulator, hydrogen peroxide-inducible genes activator
MTLQDLRYVLAVADHGNFSRAAAACDIGQPTLSTQIKKLETELGVTLFERTSRSVCMTVVGAKIVSRARQVLADVAQPSTAERPAHLSAWIIEWIN